MISDRGPGPMIVPVVLAVVWSVACAANPAARPDPSHDVFFDGARQLMTDNEAEIFKTLPDEAARAGFIREFWAARDPDPKTPENEALIEFEKRARYAALWFGTHNPYRGNDPGGPLRNVAGLSDERGRTYILLGQPDTIIFFDGLHERESRDGSRSRLQFDLWILEQWIYDDLHTYVVFRRTPGGPWYTDSFQSNYLDRLEGARLNWLRGDDDRAPEAWFRFSAEYGPAGLQLEVPADRVSTDDRFQVELDILVTVYRDGQKVDEIRETKSLTQTRENLFDEKALRFSVPYSPAAKGDYLFDIVVRDLQADSPSQYRVVVKKSF